MTENWNQRRLTLFVKITVIKSLMVSQLVYILTPLPICQVTIKEINDLLLDSFRMGKVTKLKAV